MIRYLALAAITVSFVSAPATARQQGTHSRMPLPVARPDLAPQPFAVTDLAPTFGMKICRKGSHYYPACLYNHN